MLTSSLEFNLPSSFQEFTLSPLDYFSSFFHKFEVTTFIYFLLLSFSSSLPLPSQVTFFNLHNCLGTLSKYLHFPSFIINFGVNCIQDNVGHNVFVTYLVHFLGESLI